VFDALKSKKLDRDVVWDDPFASLALAKGRSGLELLTTALNGTYPAPPMAASMNMRIVEVAHGRVVFEGDPVKNTTIPSASCMAAGRFTPARSTDRLA